MILWLHNILVKCGCRKTKTPALTASYSNFKWLLKHFAYRANRMEPFTYLIQQKQGDGFMVFRLDSRTGECDIECMPEKILEEMSFKESPPRTLGELVDNLPAWGAEAEGIQFRSPSDVATPLTVPALSEGMAQ